MTNQERGDPRKNPQPISDQESGSFPAPQTPAAGSAPDAEPEPERPDPQKHPSPSRTNANEELLHKRGEEPK
jgi:hypothetical protein